MPFGCSARSSLAWLLRHRLDALAFALFLLLAIWITWPWARHPLTTTIGGYDPQAEIINTDAMLAITFTGWMNFAAFELLDWPLSSNRHLSWPVGGSQGRSYDGLLFAFAVAAFDLALPLLLAYSLAVLLAPLLCGWFSYRLARRLYGRGGPAGLLPLAIGLSAESTWFISQRLGGHPNLLYIWTIPVAMHLFHNFMVRPTWRRALGLAGGTLLMGLASFYLWMIGMVYLAVAAAVTAWCWRRRADRAQVWQRLAVGLGLGVALVVLMITPMLLGIEHRAPFQVASLAEYSAPLIQYLLPAGDSLLGRMLPFARAQGAVGSNWEALTVMPIAALLAMLLPVFNWSRRGRRYRAVMLGTAAAGMLVSLGPFMQLAHALAPGEGLRLPTYYLVNCANLFGVFRVPGRMHVIVAFAALFAAGFVLLCVRRRWLGGPLGRRYAWPALLLLFTALNLAWTLPTGAAPVFPNPKVPEFYRALARKGGRGAILDLPFNDYGCGLYTYYQFTHKRPNVVSTYYHDGLPPRAYEFFVNHRLMIMQLPNLDHWKEEDRQRVLTSKWMRRLARRDIEYIVIHPAFVRWGLTTGRLLPQTEQLYAEFETRWKDRLVYSDDQIRVYATGMKSKE